MFALYIMFPISVKDKREDTRESSNKEFKDYCLLQPKSEKRGFIHFNYQIRQITYFPALFHLFIPISLSAQKKLAAPIE